MARPLAHPRAHAVGADHEDAGDRRAVGQAQRGVGARPCERSKPTPRAHVDARRVHAVDRARAQRALLDDPRERALAEVVRGELEPPVAIAFDAHRLDRRTRSSGSDLPCADALQERRAAGADRVDAQVQTVIGVARASGARSTSVDASPCRASAGASASRQPGAGHDHVRDGARARRPAASHRASAHASSVSTTICWLV
jgi:hypothetical protein